MVLVDIQKKEVETFDKVLKNVEASIPDGYVLGTLRMKIQLAFMKEQEKQLREKYGEKKKQRDKTPKA